MEDPKIYHDNDVQTDILKDKKIAVIGYGSQGMAQAQCMKDSGLDVIVGLRRDGASWQKAVDDGMDVMVIDEAARQADIIHILVPDEVQKEVYDVYIKGQLAEGKTLSFSHGFNVAFNQIMAPEGGNVIMVAPKGPGNEVRGKYGGGTGVGGFVAVEKDATGDAGQIALEMAKAMGFTRAGVFECTFRQEACSDLFGEQAVLCGGVTELVKAGFETLVKRGYPPHIAYFECFHEVKLIVDLLYEGGLVHMWDVVSNTAEYGGRTVGPKIIGAESRKAMEQALDKIESGDFAREWLNEYGDGCRNLGEMREKERAHELETTGRRVRSMFEKS